MEDDPDFYVSSLTIGQEKGMALVPIFSSMLSIFGSSVILYQVTYTSKKKKMTPYKRLLFGLSSCDIVASLTFALQGFFSPSDSRRYYAIGNDTSCTILGAFTQFAFAAVWYNGFLSYYYLATIRFKVNSKAFSKKYEPLMHFSALGFNLLTAVSGALFHHYGEASIGAGCWVVSRCVNGHCVEWPNGWVFAGFPVIFLFISIVVNNCIIYCQIRGNSMRGTGGSGNNKVLQEEHHKVRSVATQAFGYVVSFSICYTPCFVIKGIESFGGVSSAESDLYPLLLLTSIFLPLQGFFNMVVYCRPSYIKYRARFPNESKLWAIRHAMLGSELLSVQSHGKINASSMGMNNNSSTMETGSQTSVAGMDSTSFFELNNSGSRLITTTTQTSKQQQRHVISKISSVLFSVEESNEESDRSDNDNMTLNTRAVQPYRFDGAVDVLQERQSSELYSDFEAELRSGGCIIEEKGEDDDDDVAGEDSSDSDDSSRMSTGREEEDMLHHTYPIYLESENKEEYP